MTLAKIAEILERQVSPVTSDAGLSVMLEGLEIGKSTAKVVNEIARALQSAMPLDNSKIYAEQLEFIKQFRKEGKAQTALNLLLKYKIEHWGKIDEELRYKVLASLGTLSFELNKKNEGAKQLLELKDINYHSADRLAYLCLGYALLDMKEDFEKAFVEAKLMQPDNINLWIAFILTQDLSISASVIKDSVPDTILEKPQILYALGEAFVNRGEVKRGFEMLANSAALSGDSIEANWYVLSMVESRKLLHLATREKIALNQFSKEELGMIKEARDVLTSVWNYVRNTELSSAAWQVILNRGITNKILGDDLAAEDDLVDAWRISHDFFAFKDLFFHYIDIARLDKAEALLRSADSAVIDIEDRIEFASCQARLYGLQRLPAKAAEALLQTIEFVDQDYRLRLLDLIVLTYFQCGEFSNALPYADRIIEEFESSPEGYLAQGVCYRILKSQEEALKSLDNATARATKSPTLSHVWYQLGKEYGSLGRHEQAVSCFEKVCRPDVFDEPCRKLLLEYYRAELYSKAIDLALRAVAIIPVDPLANEILFRAYQDVGDNGSAAKVLEAYLITGIPKSLDHFRLLGVKFFSQIGQTDKAVELILAIEKPEAFSLSQRLVLARQLIETAEYERGFEMAFDARLDHYNEASAHELYITCCVGGKEQSMDVLFPDTVAMDCAVCLLDESGASRHFFLTNDKRYQSAAIVREDEKWAKLLIGKKRGEAIFMQNSVGIGSILTVTEIINKHVYAFRESGELLETKFSGETKMQFLKWNNDDDFALLTEFLKKQLLTSQQNRQAVLRVYNSEFVTVGMLGSHFSRNFVEIWFELIANPDAFLHCYGHDENENLSTALSEEQWIIVDPIAILTNLVLIPDHDLTSLFAGKAVVAQSAVTELKQFKSQLELRGPNVSIGVEDGELRRHEQTQESTENIIRLVEKMIDWCEKNAVIKKPIKRSHKIRSDEVEVITILGQSFHDSVLLALEVDGSLLSDDQRLKSFALAQYGIKSFSTYQLGIQKMNVGQLTIPEFNLISETLVRSNYAYIPVTGEILWKLFDESGFRLQSPFSRGIRSLRIMTPPYCAKAIVDFAKLLYLNITLASLRERSLHYVLQETKHNINFETTRLIAVQMLDQAFSLMPIHKKEVLSVIDSVSVLI